MKGISKFVMSSSLLFCGMALEAGNKPNIVFILAEDLGWTGLGCYGSNYYETPNIDMLAAQGMRFTQGYACASVSAPSRAALMSGQYSSRNGTLRVSDVPKKNKNYQDYIGIQPPNRPFPEDIMTMAELLKSGGYVTGMFGKWHIEPGDPGVHGFDNWISSSGKHFGFKTSPGYEVADSVYLSDFMADKAIEFIEDNKERPFFLYLPDFLVHKPHEAKQRLIDKYKNKKGYRGQKDPVYAAMTESLDQTVGRIYRTLEKNGLLDNALIVFSSDNGAQSKTNSDGTVTENSYTDNLPLRHGKGLMYEGGLRVPYIFMWKGKIKPGTVSDEAIIGLDLYPTFANVARCGLPDQPVDGVDLTPLLIGKVDKLDERALYWYYPNYGPAKRKNGKVTYANIPTDVIIYGDYKLQEYYHCDTEHLELYNLKEDISESDNLINKEKGMADKLLKMLCAWQHETGAVRPVKNEKYVPSR